FGDFDAHHLPQGVLIGALGAGIPTGFTLLDGDGLAHRFEVFPRACACAGDRARYSKRESGRRDGADVSVPRLTLANPPELIVYDRAQRCPYLQDRVARMPLRLPARPLSREELDERLEAGDRRQGFVLYRTHCPQCVACEPIRIAAGDYTPTKSQRRILQRGDAELKVLIGPPQVDGRRVDIYNEHKSGRGLNDGQPPIDAEGYRDFLVS